VYRVAAVIEYGEQSAGREDADVGAAILELFPRRGDHRPPQDAGPQCRRRIRQWRADRREGPDGEGIVEGTDLLVGVGRTPNTGGIGLERAGVKLTETG
jgi:pyruvate/2-oxoglutarate dehydrogenase complex dihydrolipoamide dehydrogenase (E3) component